MLIFDPRPHLLLEALAYLGRRAAGNTWQRMESRLKERRIPVPEDFRVLLAELTALTARLDSRVIISQEALALFRDLEGTPHSTVGTGSIAFSLFYPLLESWDGSWNAFYARACALPAAQAAGNMALALELTDTLPPQGLTDREFLDSVLSSSLPDATRLAVLDAYRVHPSLTVLAGKALAPVLAALERERPTLERLAEGMHRRVGQLGCESYLAATSRLRLSEGTLRPFLMGMDTSLTSHTAAQVYCGIGREALQEMLSGQTPVRDDVYEAFKLLGDRTRFDILCHLRGRSAYGQELSAHFGLSRNTIHHHMNKLAAYGLVRCTTDGNRIYYTLDQETVRILLDRQKQLFGGEG